MNDVSFVIVNWNTRDYSVQCIRSLYDHLGYMEFEILFVDNGSDDGSVEAIAAQFPDVNVVSLPENVGFAKGVNIGVRECTGDYICLLNSDVEMIDESFKDIYENFRENKKVGICGPKLLFENLEMQYSCKRYPSLWIEFCTSSGLNKLFPKSGIFASNHMTEFDHDQMKEVDSLVGACLLVRRDVFREVGLLDESFFMYGEETDFCRRAKMAGWKILFDPSARIIHYGGVSSDRDPDRFVKEYHRSAIYFWKKNYGPLRLLLFSVMVIFKLYLRTVKFKMTVRRNGQNQNRPKYGRNPESPRYDLYRETRCLYMNTIREILFSGKSDRTAGN